MASLGELRAFVDLGGVALGTAYRRLRRGARYPEWGLGFEALNEFLARNMRKVAELEAGAPQRAFLDGPAAPSVYLGRVRREERETGGRPATWFIPEIATSDRTLLYFHGGGYVVYPKTHAGFIASLALATRAPTLAPDYRMAPEHPFPAAVDDAVAAYKDLLDRGIDPAKLVIGGDSAGGGLSLATLLRLRDEGITLPAMAVLISPWVDLGNAEPSIDGNAECDWLSPVLLRQWAAAYLGGAAAAEPLASSLRAVLKGLPPLYLQGGEAELLIDQIRAFAAKAEEAGVEATLDVWPGMTREWHILVPMVAKSREALERIGERVDRALGE